MSCLSMLTPPSFHTFQLFLELSWIQKSLNIITGLRSGQVVFLSVFIAFILTSANAPGAFSS